MPISSIESQQSVFGSCLLELYLEDPSIMNVHPMGCGTTFTLIVWLLTSPYLTTHSLASRRRVKNTFTLSWKVEYIGVDVDESEVLKQQFR